MNAPLATPLPVALLDRFKDLVGPRGWITDPDLLGPQGPNQPLSGEIWFVGTRVVDQYTGSEVLNPRTSSFSIFHRDLEGLGHRVVFTLNRLNYAAANEFLLPRAAAS